MTIRDTIGVYDQSEFAHNPEVRCPIVLILDVSGSMAGAKIDTLNQALVKFRDIIREDSVTALRADVAIIEFDDDARVYDFTNGADFEPPALEPKGETNFSKPINVALDLIEARKQSYRDGGVAYYRSLAYFLTDGMPDDDPADLDLTARRLAQVEENRGVAFFSFIIGSDRGDGVPNFTIRGENVPKFYQLIGFSEADLYAAGAFGSSGESATGLDVGKVAEMMGTSATELVERCVREGIMQTAMGELTKLAPREPKELTNLAQLEGSIQWLSRSVTSVSKSQPGDSIRLPEPDYLNF